MTIKESVIDHRVDVENLLIVFHNVRLGPGLGFPVLVVNMQIESIRVSKIRIFNAHHLLN